MNKLTELDQSKILKDLNSFDHNKIQPKADISPNIKIINSILEGLKLIKFIPLRVILEVKNGSVFLKTSKDDTSSIPLFGLYTKKHLTGIEEFDKLKYHLFFCKTL